MNALIRILDVFIWTRERWLSDRTPDSQLRDPGFESPLLPFQSLGLFILSMTPQFTQLYKWVPDYRMWVIILRTVIATWLECFPEKSSWCRNEQVCQGWHVKHFERSSGLDTALYKNILLQVIYWLSKTVSKNAKYSSVKMIQPSHK